MADTRGSRVAEEDRQMADPPPYPGTPRSVTVFGIISVVLLLLIAIVMCTGVAGGHGPGRHMPSGGGGGDTQPITHAVQRP